MLEMKRIWPCAGLQMDWDWKLQAWGSITNFTDDLCIQKWWLYPIINVHQDYSQPPQYEYLLWIGLQFMKSDPIRLQSGKRIEEYQQQHPVVGLWYGNDEGKWPWKRARMNPQVLLGKLGVWFQTCGHLGWSSWQGHKGIVGQRLMKKLSYSRIIPNSQAVVLCPYLRLGCN